MIYTCEKCFVTFDQKSHYTVHINRKKPCVPEEKEQYDVICRTCEYCPKVFSAVCAKKTHMIKCKYKPSEIEELKQIIVQLSDKLNEQTIKHDEQNIKLNNELKEIKEKVEKPNITNNIIQQNLIVTQYGKEDLSFLTIKDYARIFKKGCYSIPEILRLIHCNNNKPEYRNVCIKNFKDEYMLTFDGIDWDIEKKDIILNNMFESKKYLLECKFEDYQAKLPQYAITMFKKFLERSENDEVIANIKDELKNMFYKNRNHVIDNVKTLLNDKEKKPKKKVSNKLIKDQPIIAIEKKPNEEKKPKKKPKKKVTNNTKEQPNINIENKPDKGTKSVKRCK
jgi:hypothetical protein